MQIVKEEKEWGERGREKERERGEGGMEKERREE